MNTFKIETPRFILREWRDSDLEPFARMNADPSVMEYIGPPQSLEQSSAVMAAQQAFQAKTGHCYWAIERCSDAEMIGFCGLKHGPAGTPVAGKIDMGWRLARASWGHGYAREAASACIAWGFANLPCDAIWAKTVPANTRSWGLMRRLGMQRVEGGDFDHPALAKGDPLRRHVLYRISRPR